MIGFHLLKIILGSEWEMDQSKSKLEGGNIEKRAKNNPRTLKYRL